MAGHIKQHHVDTVCEIQTVENSKGQTLVSLTKTSTATAKICKKKKKSRKKEKHVYQKRHINHSQYLDLIQIFIETNY